MRRRAKPGKGAARLSVTRKSPKIETSGRRELEKRLAESLEREKATGEILQEKDRALTEALEQQTATAEILRVISESPTDLQPVLDTVVKSAARFCGARDAELFHLDGGALRLAAHHGPLHIPFGLLVPVVRGTVGGRSVLERRAVHVENLQTEAKEFPEGSAFARDLGYRTNLAVPLLREGEPIGTIQLRRTEVSPFTDKQIALLQTFADQAIIAIENVRLFTELEGRNRDLTATGEILRVISSSPTDVQPVFEAIMASAIRLCDATFGGVFRFHDGQLHVAALPHLSPEETSAYHSQYPRPPHRDSIMGRAFLDGLPVHVDDVLADPTYDPGMQVGLQRVAGYRSVLAVPILRNGVPIGVVGCAGREVKAFTPAQIELVKTFD